MNLKHINLKSIVPSISKRDAKSLIVIEALAPSLIISYVRNFNLFYALIGNIIYFLVNITVSLHNTHEPWQMHNSSFIFEADKNKKYVNSYFTEEKSKSQDFLYGVVRIWIYIWRT